MLMSGWVSCTQSHRRFLGRSRINIYFHAVNVGLVWFCEEKGLRDLGDFITFNGVVVWSCDL
jgi:hypothetical protein